MKVHGSNTSTATLRVVATLHEKQLDFDFVFVNLRTGSHKEKPFLSLNPFGQVPAFEDGDLQLFESRAITKYIASAYDDNGTPLIYKDPKQMAILGVWMEVEALQFDIAGSALVWELFYKNSIYGQPPDAAVVEENEKSLANVLDVYEGRLGKSKYLGGDSFTLADLHHLPIVHLLMDTKEKKHFDERPHVSAWSKDILSRPSWQKAIAMWKQVY